MPKFNGITVMIGTFLAFGMMLAALPVLAQVAEREILPPESVVGEPVDAPVGEIVGGINLPLTQDREASLTESDLVPPSVNSFTPIDGSTNVSTTTTVVLNFSEPLDLESLSGASFHIKKYNGGDIVPTSWNISEDNTVVTVTPEPLLEYNTKFYIFIEKNVADMAGNKFGESWYAGGKDDHEFTTETEVVPPPPPQNMICRADMNDDNFIDWRDIDSFEMVKNYQDFFRQFHPSMFWQVDLNGNDTINQADIDAFTALMNSAVKTENCQGWTGAGPDNPPLNTGMRGDMNNDGFIDWRDIDDFKMVYSYPDFFRDYHLGLFNQADITGDSVLNVEDMDAFVALMNTPASHETMNSGEENQSGDSRSGGRRLPTRPSGLPTTPTVLGAQAFHFGHNLTWGTVGAEVEELQARLGREGFFLGPITGYFGPLTQSAVKAFQKTRGITMTGLVGPLTRFALNGTATEAEKPVVINYLENQLGVAKAQLQSLQTAAQ